MRFRFGDLRANAVIRRTPSEETKTRTLIASLLATPRRYSQIPSTICREADVVTWLDNDISVVA